MKSILLITLIGLITIMSLTLVVKPTLSNGAVNGSSSLEFSVSILTDTTISMPSPVCETAASTISGVLEFTPGIDGLDTTNSRPIDGCGDATHGDYNITNDGNVAIDLSFKLNESAPTGVTIALGSVLNYDNSDYINLTTGDSTPSWGTNIAKESGSDVVQVYQRIGADDSAAGDTSFVRTIIVTSLKH